MEKYEKIKKVGSGNYGNVWKASDKHTGEVFAIKRIKKKYRSKELNLREIKSLRRMDHPNIVKLKDVITEHDTLYFVFEYLECTLYQLMQQTRMPIPEERVKRWSFQLLQGLAHVHQHGFFHRDLKPDNLLISKDADIKIADFGQAREIDSQSPYTDYVTTRWYRAPEILLRSKQYGSAVDLWAVGVIMAELFILRPLFPGSSEADEINKICSVLGSPTENNWSEGLKLASDVKYQFPQVAGAPFSTLMPSAGKDAIDLITSLCSWDPSKRPTASEALNHPFFQSCLCTPPISAAKVLMQESQDSQIGH